jgi:branched-chain amino acid aminotransferase
MSENPNYTIKVTKAETSKIGSVNFDDLPFGSIFTDHMLYCDYKDGEWGNPVIEPYAPIPMDPSSRVFHYGQAIFEGMKAYKDDNDDVWLFRPDRNFERFNKSATRLAMPEIPEEIFMDGLKQLIAIDKEWVKKGKGNSLYLRPFMIATGHGVIAAPSAQYRFMIILSPAKAYYQGEVKVLIAEHYSRAAKAAGNYSAQFYPTRLANQKGYQQVIWTDDATHTKLEEAGTMNVFFKINDILYTAPTSERILDGVTRKSILELAERENIKVEVRSVLVEELLAAAKDGSLKEIFGAGTAAVVNPIIGFSYQDTYYEIEKQENPLSLQIKDTLTNIQHKLAEDTFGWTVKI